MRNVFFIFFRYCNNSRKKNIKYYRIKINGREEIFLISINYGYYLTRAKKNFFLYFLGQKLTNWKLQPKLQQLSMFLLLRCYNCYHKINKILCQTFNLCYRSRSLNQLLLMMKQKLPKTKLLEKKLPLCRRILLPLLLLLLPRLLENQ